VKVDDHTAPTEVGRIYFALDTSRRRLVVDFFGVKADRPSAQAAALSGSLAYAASYVRSASGAPR
jgi:hypothetical protein